MMKYKDDKMDVLDMFEICNNNIISFFIQKKKTYNGNNSLSRKNSNQV